MSTTTNDSASTFVKVQRSLQDHRGLRYVLTGVILLIIAVPQMFIAKTTASSGHFIIAGIGLVLIVAGAVTAKVKTHR
jgi:uncharacterized membrane protein